MLSLDFLNRLWWIGVITPTDGRYPYYVGVDTHLITATAAGPMAGAASTVAGVGDGTPIIQLAAGPMAGAASQWLELGMGHHHHHYYPGGGWYPVAVDTGR